MNGNISSFQSLGAVDGPGIRYVVFMQGCPLKCSFCHNPETWDFSKKNSYSAQEIFEKIKRYKPYFANGGGVTISGGEALMQPQFCFELFSLLKSEGIHTCLDTSGIGEGDWIEKLLSLTDLVICDIKFSTNEKYLEHTTVNLDRVINFLRLTEKKGVPLWIRHVIIPSITDFEREVKEIIKIAQSFSNLKKIEFLPFKNICQTKYDSLKMEFKLKNVPPCSPEKLNYFTTFIPDKFR